MHNGAHSLTGSQTHTHTHTYTEAEAKCYKSALPLPVPRSPQPRSTHDRFPLFLCLRYVFSWKAKLTICKIHVKISEKYIFLSCAQASNPFSFRPPPHFDFPFFFCSPCALFVRVGSRNKTETTTKKDTHEGSKDNVKDRIWNVLLINNSCKNIFGQMGLF